MKVSKRDGTGEREILIGMIVSRPVLGTIAARWDGKFFSSPWANLIGGWAVSHHARYKKPPGPDIVGYFDRWAETKQRDKEVVQIVEDFLGGLSGEYAQHKKAINPEYLIDRAGEYFTQVGIKNLHETVGEDIEAGDYETALTRVNGFRPVQIGGEAFTSMFNDVNAILAAFEAREADLITYKEGCGNFFKGILGRDCFVAFWGMAKVGKSWWLHDVAYRGVQQGLKVAYFEVGDLSKSQVIARFAVRTAKHPLDPEDVEWPTGIDLGPPVAVETETRSFAAGLTGPDAAAAMLAFGERYGRDQFRLIARPNRSLSVTGIEAILDQWGNDGWNPDVIVIDYADILAPNDRTLERRDQINDTWASMRALSQRLHCLVVTASQSDAASYSKHTLSRENFTDDRRKLDHVTACVGINQTKKEKNKFHRLNMIEARELRFDETISCYSALCLALANPSVHSTFAPPPRDSD